MAGAATMNARDFLEKSEDAPELLEETPATERKRGRKWLAFALPGVLVLGGGAGVYAFLTMGPDSPANMRQTVSDMKSALFVEAPQMVVSVRGGDGRAHFLKLRFVIVASSEGKADEIKDKMPIVVDSLQSFLRELRPEDLAGSAAVYRIKEEIMIRMRRSFGPDTIEDVLIQDLIEQ